MTIQKIWDDTWRHRNTVSDYSLQYALFIKHFSSILPNGAKVLEAGYGSADTLALFKKQETCDLDFSKKKPQSCQRQG